MTPLCVGILLWSEFPSSLLSPFSYLSMARFFMDEVKKVGEPQVMKSTAVRKYQPYEPSNYRTSHLQMDPDFQPISKSLCVGWRGKKRVTGGVLKVDYSHCCSGPSTHEIWFKTQVTPTVLNVSFTTHHGLIRRGQGCGQVFDESITQAYKTKISTSNMRCFDLEGKDKSYSSPEASLKTSYPQPALPSIPEAEG